MYGTKVLTKTQFVNHNFSCSDSVPETNATTNCTVVFSVSQLFNFP